MLHGGERGSKGLIMSRKLPLYAVDKCRVMIILPADIRVKLEVVARQNGSSLSSICASCAANLVRDVSLTVADRNRIEQIIQENQRKRQVLKARRGLT